MAMAPDPHHLSHAMEARRVELDVTWADLAAAARVSVQGLRDIRSGKSTPRPATKRRIEQAFGWAKGTFDDVRRGAPPRLAPTPTPEGRLIAQAAQGAKLSIGQAALRAGLTEDVWITITTSDERAAAVDLARAAHVAGLRPTDLINVGRPDAAGELRLIESWEGTAARRPEPAPGPDSSAAAAWTDPAERAVWGLTTLSHAEKTNVIAQIRVSRVADSTWPDPAEREIWDLPTLGPADKAALIVLLRVGRVTADLRAELAACREELRRARGHADDQKAVS